MELKSKVDLKQAAAEARGRAEGAEGRLREKERELQVRTDELIEARSGHETRIEQELRRLAEVQLRYVSLRLARCVLPCSLLFFFLFPLSLSLSLSL
eukprot:2542925-Rhodomonas_salina.1